MNIPRTREWSEGVGQDEGSIIMESNPWPLYIIDRWLYVADEVLHFIERRLPRDAKGHSVIDRIDPDYGNPICYTYLYGWGNWYRKFWKQEVWVDVPLDKLSAKTQEWNRKEREFDTLEDSLTEAEQARVDRLTVGLDYRSEKELAVIKMVLSERA